MMSRGLVSMVILLLSVRVTDGEDLPVTCVFSEDCVLPCSFQPGRDELIHWIKLEDITVHSYYNSTDQLEPQNQQYRQRTSLYNDQIPKGNASLLLRNVKVQDQGRYQCYTSTVKGNQESLVNITVKAPVRSVDIHLSDDILTCSSTGIYPQPKLTWSTHPPSESSQNSTSTKVNDQGLYDITSTKPFIRNRTNICTVTSGKTEKTATLRQRAPVHSSPSSEVSIPCNDSQSDLTSNITWRFNQNVTILTLTYTNDKYQMQVEDHWKEQVQNVSDSVSLRLHRITMNHQGNYSCELTTDRDTHLVLTFLEITPDKRISSGNIAGGVTGGVTAVAVAVAVWSIYKRRCKKNPKAETPVKGEMQPMIEKENDGDGDVAGNTEGVVAGNTEGVVAGNTEGVVEGNTEGEVAGNKEGVVAGNKEGVVAGNTEGVVVGNTEGVVAGKKEGVEAGKMEGVEAGNKEGVVAGNSEGVVAGNKEGVIAGNSEGVVAGNKEGVVAGRMEGVEAGNKEGVVAGNTEGVVAGVVKGVQGDTVG
uniref:Ig-like domain-containing protein n=1 Tax=Esox lucius TaxID=8010 RepID=A0AAY5KJ29_ESOLU